MNTNQYIPALANPFDCDYYGKEFAHNQNMVDHRFIQSEGKSFSEHRHSQAMNMNSQQFVPFEANSHPCGVYGLNLPQNQHKEHRLAHSSIAPLSDQRNSQAINMATDPYTSGESNYSASDVNGINLTQQQHVQERNLVRNEMLPFVSYKGDGGLARKEKRPRERNFVCEVCGRGFSEMSSLTVHSRTHSGDRPFPCEVCEKKFASKEGLRSHLVSHSEERRFKCDLCDKKYTTKQSMQHHRVMHTGEKPYACEVCQKAFSIRKTLLRHMMTHSEERPFSCDQCDKKFKSKRHVQIHSIFHAKEKPLLCDLCPDRFFRPQQLRNHQQRVHFGVKPYHCKVCPKQYSNKECFLKHVQSHDEQSDSQTLDTNPDTIPVENPPNVLQGPKISREEPHMCVTCREEFADECELEKHRLHHKREKPFSCFICRVRFFRSPNLKLHLSTFHSSGFTQVDPQEKKSLKSQHFPCALCDKSFLSKPHLQSHMLSHTRSHNSWVGKNRKGQGKIACDQCGKRFMRHANLRYHVSRYHCDSLTESTNENVGEKTHQCSVCSKKFKDRSTLRTHVSNVHTEGQPYLCPTCHRRFKTKNNLVEHFRNYHEKDSPRERPHQCSVCSKKFLKRAHLRRHSLVHTGEKPFVCPACQKQFKDKYTLQDHYLRYHGELSNLQILELSSEQHASDEENVSLASLKERILKGKRHSVNKDV